MGQCWELVDLDGEVIVGDHGGGKLGEWFWDHQWGIMDAFRVPVYGARVDELLQGPMTEQPACALLRLVQDIFNLILDELAKDYVALLCYAVTCKAALAGCREYIIAHQRRHCKPLLAGHRLVCIGEYANRPWKLPPEMLTDEEVDELEAYGRSHQELPCLFYYAQHHFDRLPSHELGFRSDDALRALDGVAYRRRRWHPQDWALVQSVARPCYPEDRPWALCNLLTLEYGVREDVAVQLCESLPDNPSRWSRGEKERPTFWHFLLANICWSPDPTNSMPYNQDDLTQGRWAGDWFEVTLLENLRPASTDDENQWTDVTDEIGALVKRIWEAQVVNDNGRG